MAAWGTRQQALPAHKFMTIDQDLAGQGGCGLRPERAAVIVGMVIIAIALAACGPSEMTPVAVVPMPPTATCTGTATPEWAPTPTAWPTHPAARTPTAPPSPTTVPTPVQVSPSPTPRQPIVVLDPGHTAQTVGAQSADGSLVEHQLTLSLAYRLAPMLQRSGFEVHITRRPDGSLVLPIEDLNKSGTIEDHEELQPRIDLANLVSADVVVSLHFNGSPDPLASGTSVYYANTGPYITESMKLATIMQRSLVAAIRADGYNTTDLGALSDRGLKSYGTLYSLGQNPQMVRKGRWPGVLIEPLFLTNSQDAAYLRRPHALDAIAQGCLRSLCAYFDLTCYRLQRGTQLE